MAYGDTHVTPAPLFDPQGSTSTPPGDALDIYFPAPMSLSLFGDALARTPRMEHLLPQLADVCEQALNAAITVLQRTGGYVVVQGCSAPARLELAGLSENDVSGEEIMRLHAHVYLGRTATTVSDGSRWPIDQEKLRRAVKSAWGTYHGDLIRLSTDVFGLLWSALPGHHPADKEITDPPFAEHVGEHAPPHLAVCPGRFGQREQIIADETSRLLMRKMERNIVAEHRRAG